VTTMPMTQVRSGPEQANGSRSAGPATDPVFVLCAARSGSTLLRFLLDAHPELACPPETNVPALCGQLATVWSLIEGAPLSPNRGDEPPDIPDAAIAGVRETMGRMVGSYLARRGKQRYCDKSLGTARFASLVTRIWPEARFICLFRHPMDLVASGMEACPWGLNGYGFDPYIAETPGNAVFALARFWADNTAAILAAEEQYAASCCRVRYEDLVADVQAVSDRIFDFLKVARVPDIEARIFAPERERFGPADYKIWHTSGITAASVGRGWTLPAEMISPQVREMVNELCGSLGYVPVDDKWGTAACPADLRLAPGAGVSSADDTPAGPRGEGPVPGESPAGAGTGTAAGGVLSHTPVPEPVLPPVVGERLAAGLARTGPDFARRWDPCAAESFELIVTTPEAPGRNTRWLVDLSERTVTQVDGTVGPTPAARPDGIEENAEDSGGAWDMIASAETWEQLISGRVNLSVALRRNQMRYCDEEEDATPVIAATRIGLLADLLGLASWAQTRPDIPVPGREKARI
jgi:sulfotransferase family protein